MRCSSAFIAFIALASCHRPLQRPVIVQKDAAVRIETVCAAGTGVIVGSHTILTALHVLTCDNSVVDAVKVTLPSGRAYIADTEVAVFKDLGRLHVNEDLAFKAPHVASAKVGRQVCAETAVPKRGRTCGTVTTTGIGDSDIAFTADVTFGNSGSGVYDANGFLVGIVTRKVMAGGAKATQLPPWLIREDIAARELAVK